MAYCGGKVGLMGTIEHMFTSGFFKSEYSDMIINIDDPEKLLSAINSYKAAKKKWI